MSVNAGQRNIKNTEFNQKCYSVDSALDLAQHTLKICSNDKIFLPQYKEFLTDRIVNLALDVYSDAYSANRIRVKSRSEAIKRNSLQIRAILGCDKLIGLINVARRTFHLRNGKVDYWVRKTIETRDLLKSWNKSNNDSYGM